MPLRGGSEEGVDQIPGQEFELLLALLLGLLKNFLTIHPLVLQLHSVDELPPDLVTRARGKIPAQCFAVGSKLIVQEGFSEPRNSDRNQDYQAFSFPRIGIFATLLQGL